MVNTRSNTDATATQPGGVLSNPGPSSAPTENANSSFQSTNSHTDSVQEVRSTQPLDALISSIVCRILEKQGPDLVHSVLNPNADHFSGTDQQIALEHRDNLSGLDKIPDVVRCLREFSGDPGQFNSWKKSVDRVLQIYEPLIGTPKYYGILSVIRSKIVGNADTALESYNTPLNWASMSRCLVMHYADKRDLGTLEYQMASIVQGRNTIQDFYQEVYSHLSLIINKIGCMDITPESTKLLTQTYRDKALDTFIRGLRGDLPRLLGIREPADLPQALHLCLKLENQNFRSQYAYSNQALARKPHNTTPLLPQHRNSSYNPVQSQYRPSFHQQPQMQRPHTGYTPRPTPLNFVPRQNSNQNPNYTNFSKQFSPKPPQPKVEPIENTPTAQTRGTYKQNKFQTDQSRQIATSNKFQRNFHIDVGQDEFNSYDQAIEQTDDLYDQSLNDYANEQFKQESTDNEEPNDFSDIHFLD